MNPEPRICKNCSATFTIEPDDFSFYEKVAVPPPTWCPKCRMIRRMSCANSWSLFYRNCNKCGKRTLSAYPPSSKLTVYCQPCWWGDSWDGTEYAMDYNPNRPFFEQLLELSEKTPYVALESTYLTLKNCDYTNAIAYSKNCLLTTWADHCENVCYSSILNEIKDTADSLRIQSSQLCYESIGQNKCYRMFYSQECDGCTDVWFSRNCYGCMNCVGCVNLRKATYQIFNEQYSKEDYFKKVAELRLDTRAGIEAIRAQTEEFWKKFPYRVYTGDAFNFKVTGEYVCQSKVSKDMYICYGAENCRWCQLISVAPAKDCVDYSGWGNNAQLIYECANVGDNVSGTKFSVYCFPNVTDTEYSLWCIGAKSNFGCVNLKRKGYCILNKEYGKEDYERLVAEIKEKMKNEPYTDKFGREWHYGEFFQPAFGKFAFNHSNAHKFFPQTKEWAEKNGYVWVDEPAPTVEATLDGHNLPETLAETDPAIVNQVIACTTCEKRYRVAPIELEILQKLNLPVPNRCPRCRETARFAKLNGAELYDRACAKCGKEMKTSYSPERPEIIYCESCYQNELV